jgi:peptide/nickel transport system permease protein
MAEVGAAPAALPPLERPWRAALAMLWRDKLALLAALYLTLVVLAALFGPALLEDVATDMNLRGRNSPPFTLENGWLYVLGADAAAASSPGSSSRRRTRSRWRAPRSPSRSSSAARSG